MRGVEKQTLRERIWALLVKRHAARFPFPIDDRIPNFVGAERAVARVVELPEWQRAERLKCNPDAPQRPLRRAALEAGKLVFMAVPRLRTEKCFIRLDPKKLRGKLAEASTIGGATKLGEAVRPADLGHVDLVVAGSVAVNRRGGRVGKGGGYSDLEFALARELGLVSERTPVLSTVHELQVVDDTIRMTAHDVPLDLIVTPERVIRVRRAYRKPRGIRWAELTEEQIRAMPALAALAGKRGASA
jgi:5-formyltetrahydrofolate cyclo-ligase